jgi:hypothetical protein
MSGTATTENWYSHILKSVREHEDITVLWYLRVQTDREVVANRPDITENKEDKICSLIDVAVPLNRNVIQKIKNKLKHDKYRNSVNVEYEMPCHVSNHWDHGNCN